MMRIKFALLVFALSVAPAVYAESNSELPGWMTGAWASQDGDKWSDEFWTPPRGGIMIGAARIGRGDRLIIWESTHIAHDDAGQLAFWAMPRGAPASKFPMVKAGEREIVFANAAHDYPQKIRYWREGAALKAEISLMDGSKAYQFSYQPMGQ